MYQENYQQALMTLAYWIVMADGEETERETRTVLEMLEHEQVSEVAYQTTAKATAQEAQEKAVQRALALLTRLPQIFQVRCMAWLCLIANSDGFMHQQEWGLIYKLYHHALKLDQSVILTEEKRLYGLVKGSKKQVMTL